jgi:ABC-type Fe3+-hydroxamate transport system substrate-binding protein
MKGIRRRSALLALLALMVVGFAIPALATEEAEEPALISEEPAEEAVPINADVEPAVPITTPPASDATLDWTYRYMIPLGIAVAMIVVIVTSIQYFTNVVRKRYRIVEE